MLTILAHGALGETYNIGAATNSATKISNKQVIELICELMGGSYEHVADRPGHDQRYAMDATKLRTELGWRPRYTGEGIAGLREGLIQTIGWYREHEGWWKGLKGGVEKQYAQRGQ